MTTSLRDAARAALNAWAEWPKHTTPMLHAMLDLEAALAASKTQEPVAWRLIGNDEEHAGTTLLKNMKPKEYSHKWWKLEPLYAHPAPAQTPMTTDQLHAMATDDEIVTFEEIVRAVERHHGIGGGK
jgi:hypothetical protein